MLSKGPAKKVTIYVNEDTQRHLGSLYESILLFLRSGAERGLVPGVGEVEFVD